MQPISEKVVISQDALFGQYADKFKALSDQKRLTIMHELCQRDDICVCDLVEIMGISQSKLSYHLKMLMDAELITQTKKGTWHYYQLNTEEVNHLLSKQLCCLFLPSC